MSNAYDTSMYPIGSTNPKVLSNNSSNFDDLLLGPAPSYPDRLLKRRQSWAGLENLVSGFLSSMGFEAVHLTYVDGSPLVVSRQTQLIDRAGSVYKVKMPAVFPVSLTGTWATDATLLVDVGDAALRSALATQGANIVAKSTMSVETIAELRAVPAGSLAANVWVARYTTDGAFIGSSYKLRIGDTSSVDDGGSIITHNDGVRRYELVFQDVLYAKQFGHDGLASGNGLAPVQAAIIAMYNRGGGRVVANGTINLPDTAGEILLYPNVKLSGDGLDKGVIMRRGLNKTAIRTYRPTSGYTPILCNAPGVNGFTINGISAGSGNIGIDLSNVRHADIYECNLANMQHGIYFNKWAEDNEVAFPFGMAFENQIHSCQFASCANGTSWRGAANSNTFTGNSYNSCTTAYGFSFPNNFSETNDFYNERVEGCNNWADWSEFQTQIYSQNWYGLTVENPTSNPFLCLVKDPGRQNFYGCRMIPGDNTGVSFYQLFPGVYSAIFGSKGASDRLSLGCRIPEEIWSIGGIRHLKNYGVAGYTGTIGAGSFDTVTITVTGAQPADLAGAFTDKDLLGCHMVPRVSGVNTVTVRIQNNTAAPVTLTAVSFTALIQKTGAIGPII